MDGISKPGSTLTNTSSDVPHETKSENKSISTHILGVHDERSSAYIHPVEHRDSDEFQAGKSTHSDIATPSAEDTTKHDGLDDLSKSPPPLLTSRRISAITPRPSLGCRLSSIILAQASLQSLRDGNQPGCEDYSPSPLRSVVSATSSPAMSAAAVDGAAHHDSDGCGLLPTATVRSAARVCADTHENMGTSDDTLPAPRTNGQILASTDADDFAAAHTPSSPVPEDATHLVAHPLYAVDYLTPSTPSVEGRYPEAALSAESMPVSLPAVFVGTRSSALSAASDTASPSARPADPIVTSPSAIIGTFVPVIIFNEASMNMVGAPSAGADVVFDRQGEDIAASGEPEHVAASSDRTESAAWTRLEELGESHDVKGLLPLHDNAVRPATDAGADVEISVGADKPLTQITSHGTSFAHLLAASSQSPGNDPLAPAPVCSTGMPSMILDSSAFIPQSDPVPLPTVVGPGSPEANLDACVFPDSSQESLCLAPSAMLEAVNRPVGMNLPAGHSLDKPAVPSDEPDLPPEPPAASGAIEYSSVGGATDSMDEEYPVDPNDKTVAIGIVTYDGSVPRMPDAIEEVLDLPTLTVVCDESTYTELTSLPSVTSSTSEDSARSSTSGSGIPITAIDIFCVQESPTSETDCSMLDTEPGGVQAVVWTSEEIPTSKDAGLHDCSTRSKQDVAPGSPDACSSADTHMDLSAVTNEVTSAAQGSTTAMQVCDATEYQAEFPMDITPGDVDAEHDNSGRMSSPFPSSSPPYMSSPLRSSSPSFAFSSPLRTSFGSSPPSSPIPSARRRKTVSFCLDEVPKTRHADASANAQIKRALGDADASDDTEFDVPMLQAKGAKRIKLDSELSMTPATHLPQSTRPTLASQLRERKKLAAPFRSPLVDKDAVRHGVDVVYASGKSKTGIETTKHSEDMHDKNSPPDVHALPERAGGTSSTKVVKDYTLHVAKQFKSPFHLGSGGSSSQSTTTASNIQNISTIRTLQTKIQTLRQAIRIHTGGGGNDDDELEELVNKWTTVGREVAWAVWDTVKDLDPGQGVITGMGTGSWFLDDDGGRDGGHNRGWGFDDGPGQPAQGYLNQNGEEIGEKHDDDEPRAQHTLGTMLRHLGIAPETFGWDEEEGDFVDAD